MPITTRLNDWLSQRRDQRRESEAQRTLNAALTRDDLLTDPTHPMAATVEQAVRDGADLTQTLAFPGHQERTTPLQFAVQNDLWWLQRALLAPFSAVHPVPDSVTYVDEVLVRPLPSGHEASGLDVHREALRSPLSLFAVALLRAQDALLLTPEDSQPRQAVESWLNAGVDAQGCVDGRTLLQEMARHDASFAQWPVPMLARLGVNATGSLGLGVLHTLWYEDANGESVDGFLRMMQAGADPYRADDHGNEPLHHLAQGLAEGTVKPLVIQRLLDLAPTLDWLRPNGQGETLVSIVRQAAHRVPPVVRAQASLHVMAPLVMAEERAELEAALVEARTPRSMPWGSQDRIPALEDLYMEAPDDALGPRSRP